jgi:hypothetical protein
MRSVNLKKNEFLKKNYTKEADSDHGDSDALESVVDKKVTMKETLRYASAHQAI